MREHLISVYNGLPWITSGGAVLGRRAVARAVELSCLER